MIIHKPSLGWRDVLHKMWARSVQPFWRLLETNKQTDRQAKFIYRLKLLRVLHVPFLVAILYSSNRFYFTSINNIFYGFFCLISWVFKNSKFWHFFPRQLFSIFASHKLSFESCELSQKIWVRSVQPFRRLLDPKKQTSNT